ncbi:MAG: homoserine dehydrogenase [Planctomycetaceae bacterium]|nr:homoserine dehydrogenase [Planctomycetaceae bacterium]
MQPLRVGLIGLGTVGSGVAKVLTESPQRMTHRAGRPVELTRVAVRDLKKRRDVKLPSDLLTDDPLAVAGASDVDVVLELIGGQSPAKEVVLTALEAGKDVVTANKALLCAEGAGLFSKAREVGRCIAFEAAIAGGIPIVHVLGQAMAGNQVTAIEAILNGTSNFILTEMLQRGESYDSAVREAQELGYAEADPAMDVDGTDAAQKLCLLTQLAFGTRVTPEAFPQQGIDTLDLADLQYANELGYAVKLLATAKLIDGKLEMHTQPTLIRHNRPLAQVDGAYNMVALTGDAVGPMWLSGQGAGQMPTASAVLSDLIDVAIGRAQSTFNRLDLWDERTAVPVQPAEDIYRRYYFRFPVEDRPHVIADITGILGNHSISLASVIQHEAPEVDDTDTSGAPIVPLVIMTHRSHEGKIRAASDELNKLACVRQPWVCMPVSD